jgi:hypothetical protein
VSEQHVERRLAAILAADRYWWSRSYLLLLGATGGRYFHNKSHAAKAIPQQLRLDNRGRRDAAALDRQSTQNLKGVRCKPSGPG